MSYFFRNSKIVDTLSCITELDLNFNKTHLDSLNNKWLSRLHWVKESKKIYISNVRNNWMLPMYSYQQLFIRITTSTIGVPQGSNLGPLLFTIYINNLPNLVRSSNILIFADDTKCYKQGFLLGLVYNFMYILTYDMLHSIQISLCVRPL